MNEILDFEKRVIATALNEQNDSLTGKPLIGAHGSDVDGELVGSVIFLVRHGCLLILALSDALYLIKALQPMHGVCGSTRRGGTKSQNAIRAEITQVVYVIEHKH